MLCCVFGIIGSTHAELLSSSKYTPSQMYGFCSNLKNATKRDRCFACFFGELCAGSNCSYRVTDEIQFDTNSDYNSCEEIGDDNIWSVFFDPYDCNSSWMATEPDDACQYCLWGGYSPAYKQITSLDEGIGEIIFRIDENGEFECQIPDSRYVGCAPGWYGQAYFDDSEYEWYGCYQCPDNGTSPAGIGKYTAITDCYIDPSTTLSDSVGKYVYSGKCYYTK